MSHDIISIKGGVGGVVPWWSSGLDSVLSLPWPGFGEIRSHKPRSTAKIQKKKKR